MMLKKIIMSVALVFSSVCGLNAQIIGTGDLLLPSYELEHYVAVATGHSYGNAVFKTYDVIIDVQMPVMDQILPSDQYILGGIPIESRDISEYTTGPRTVATYWIAIVYRDHMDPNASAPVIATELPYYIVYTPEYASVVPINPNRIQFVKVTGAGLDQRMLS